MPETIIDKAFFDKVHKQYDRAYIADNTNRTLAEEDLKFHNGEDHWDTEIQRQRRDELRPCLVINPLPAYTDLIMGNARQNKMSIKVKPVDNLSDIVVADTFGGLIRQIEYASDAQTAYMAGLEAATICGRGWFRVLTEWENPYSFNQVARIKRFANTLAPVVDPDSIELDISDAEFIFIPEKWKWEEVEAYKKHNKNSKLPLGWDDAKRLVEDTYWWDEEGIVITEYHWKEWFDTELYLMVDGTTRTTEQLNDNPDDEQFIAIGEDKKPMKRPTKDYVIRWAKIGYNEVIKDERGKPKEGIWLSKFFSLIPVWGNETTINGRRTMRGLIRFVKDAIRMLNYTESFLAEKMVTASEDDLWVLTKEMLGVGSKDSDFSSQWNMLGKQKQRYITFNQPEMPHGQQRPFKEPSAGISAALVERADAYNEKIKELMLISPDMTGFQTNATSGVAIQSRQAQGWLSVFSIMDSYKRSLRQCGRLLIDLTPKLYDEEDVVRILGEDESQEYRNINISYKDAIELHKRGNQGAKTLFEKYSKYGITEFEPDAILNNINTGQYDVVIEAGAFNTTRQQELIELMTKMLNSSPDLMQAIGGDFIRMFQIPRAEKMAEKMDAFYGISKNGDEQEDAKIQQQIQQAAEQQADVIIEKEKTEQAKLKTEAERLKLEATEFDTAKAEIQAKSAAKEAKKPDNNKTKK